MLATSAPKRIDLTFMITTPVVGYMVILAGVFEMKLNIKIKNNKKRHHLVTLKVTHCQSR
ncbi:hypothetical protein GCM10007157_35170 [Vreelandella hamiltonii]|uniref:Uncharacterized protein n=1 Tax=Vreelandella hamiltonii TaxID=502829 RepID=A0A8H9I8Q1_9GAMM|nr:hypothetical protein GCM10007157_35170 [Halomonas hamiltonii]